MSTEPLRVVVDGFALSDGSERRGIGTMIRHLATGLAKEPAIEVHVLARDEATLPEGSHRLRLSRHDLRPRLARYEHELRLPNDIRRARPDVVWSPATHPPRRTSAPLVQTLLDLTPLVFPHPSTARDAARWKRSAPRLRRADRVVAISRSSADQGIRLLGLDPARIEVIHLGVEHSFSPGPAPTNERPYLLYVAGWGAHKGFRELFAVTDAVADAGHPHRVVIAGPRDPWTAARIAEELRSSAHPDRVEVMGWVDDLAALYRGASAFVFPSRAEGFGLPVVEAMACGVPVIAFANTSLPEVVGDAGVLVDDGDVQEMAAAVCRVLDDHAFAAELQSAGLDRAGDFSWSAAVQGYRDILLATARR